MIYHLYHIIYTNILLPKVPYYQKFQEHLPYINFVPVSEFSLENDKIKMKLVVKYNLLKYADNEEKSQTNKSPKTLKSSHTHRSSTLTLSDETPLSKKCLKSK